jgi:hypothetical protein
LQETTVFLCHPSYHPAFAIVNARFHYTGQKDLVIVEDRKCSDW